MNNFIILIANCLSFILIIIYVNINNKKEKDNKKTPIDLNKECIDKFGENYIFDKKKKYVLKNPIMKNLLKTIIYHLENLL